MLDHSALKDTYNRPSAWLWLLSNAAYREGVDIATGVHLEPGQLIASLRFLAREWGWSKDKVSRFLKKLEGAEMIERATANATATATASATPTATGENVLTICNWAKYQGSDFLCATATATASATPTATATATNIKKTIKTNKTNNPPMIPPKGLQSKAKSERKARCGYAMEKIDAECRKIAEERGYDGKHLQELWMEFVRYWTQGEGRTTARLSWPETWRNNLKRHEERHGAPAKPRQQLGDHRKTIAENIRRCNAAAWAEAEARGLTGWLVQQFQGNPNAWAWRDWPDRIRRQANLAREGPKDVSRLLRK